MKRKANTEAEERELEEAPVPLEERVEGAEPAARPRAKGSAKSKAKAKAKRKTKARAKAHRKVMAKGAAKPGSGGEPRGPIIPPGRPAAPRRGGLWRPQLSLCRAPRALIPRAARRFRGLQLG